MNKIRLVSVLFLSCLVFMFAVCIMTQLYSWATLSAFDQNFFSAIPIIYQGKVTGPILADTKIAGFFISMIPLTFKLLAIYFLIRLFQLYSKHIIFSSENVRYIRNAGYALFIQELIKPLADFALGYVLTVNNPPGMRFAIFEITDKHLLVMLVALIIVIISWIMAEGNKLALEQAYTI